MKKAILIAALVLSMLLPFSFAAVVTTEDFEGGWTAGFNYGEFLANKWTCLGDVDCSPSGTLGVGGVQIIDETGGPKYLRLYSIYDNVNSNTKTGHVYWNITSYSPDTHNWSDITDMGISFNLRVQDVNIVYSDLYNKFMLQAYKSQTDQTNLKFNLMPYITTPGSTYSGFITNWDVDNHNVNDYPYTFTGFMNTYALDESSTGQFKTHGSCYLAEDTWGTAYVRYKINNTGGDTNSITGQEFFINGVKCWDSNITANRQVKTLGDFDIMSGLRFYVYNQVIDIDNLKVYSYDTGGSDTEEDIIYDVINDSIITSPGSDYTPDDSGDYSVSESLFGAVYAAKWLLLIALFLVGLFVVLGAKYAGMTGATMLGALSTIGFTVIGWIPIWVTVLVVVLSAIAFGSKVAGFIGGGE